MARKLLLALLATASLTAWASTPSHVDTQIERTAASTKIINIDRHSEITPDDQDSVRRVVTEFFYDQFRSFSDPGAPYFLFMSKDSQLAMGLGGTVRMRGYYDWGGAIPSSGFAPYLIPMTPDPTDRRALGTTPAGTCLFFRVIGRNKKLGNYQLYIEANFNGYGARDFHLKKAYAQINDFTIGYASSTFSDPAAEPPIVDAQGPNNKISPTAVLVRYMPVIRNKWQLAVSVETPSASIDADKVRTAAVTTWLPSAAVFAQYQWAQGQHVRLSGILRSLPYRNLMTSENHNIAGWGVQLSSVAHPHPYITTYVTANYGQGYAGLGGDLQIGNYDLIGDPARPGVLYAPASFGWCLGVQYNFRPNLFMSLSASQSRFLPKHTVSADQYKYGLFGALNVFWNLTPRIQAGAELDLGMRHNFSQAHRYARRFGLMCQFSF